MQLVTAKGAKTSASRSRRGKAVSEKKTRLAKREGAGRPSLHPGKDVTRHVTVYLTPDGWNKLDVVKAELLKRHGKDLNSVSASDAAEEGIHKLHRELTRPR